MIPGGKPAARRFARERAEGRNARVRGIAKWIEERILPAVENRFPDQAPDARRNRVGVDFTSDPHRVPRRECRWRVRLFFGEPGTMVDFVATGRDPRALVVAAVTYATPRTFVRRLAEAMRIDGRV